MTVSQMCDTVEHIYAAVTICGIHISRMLNFYSTEPFIILSPL